MFAGRWFRWIPIIKLLFEERQISARRLAYLLFAAVAAVTLFQRDLFQAVQLNWVAKETALFSFDDPSSFSKYPLSIPIIDNCRASWYQGLAERWQGNFQAAQEFWQIAIPCDPVIVSMLETLFPEDGELAAHVVQHYPGHAIGWFWRARTIREDNTVQAIEYYAKGLELAPEDGLAWREMGDLLVSEDPNAAIKAYLQSCYNGDPGSHGCWRAGQTAESIGEIENAIRYYRFSDWEGALQRADELQATSPDAAHP